MMVCIVSDSHDRAGMLLAAVAAAKTDGAAAVVHCGDIIGANTLRPLIGLGLPVHAVHGNSMACTGDYDVVCCGHSHAARTDEQATVRAGRTWLVNPGTVAGLAAPATGIFADLAALAFEIRNVPPPRSPGEETR